MTDEQLWKQVRDAQEDVASFRERFGALSGVVELLRAQTADQWSQLKEIQAKLTETSGYTQTLLERMAGVEDRLKGQEARLVEMAQHLERVGAAQGGQGASSGGGTVSAVLGFLKDYWKLLVVAVIVLGVVLKVWTIDEARVWVVGLIWGVPPVGEAGTGEVVAP